MLSGWWRLIRYQKLHPKIDGDRIRGGGDGNWLPAKTNPTKRKSYGPKLESERPGVLVSPTDSEFGKDPVSPVSPIEPAASAWPMSPPQQTSTQRISAFKPTYTAYSPPTAGQHVAERQVATGGFDSSSDEDEEEELAEHERKAHGNMV